MSPRKKSKPDSAAPTSDASGSSKPASVPSLENALPATTPAETTPSSSTKSSGTLVSQTPSGKKWLSGTGSWRSKAPAIVKTARESIGVTGGATAELPGEVSSSPRDNSPARFLAKRKSSKGDALPASMTKVNVSSDGLTEDAPTPQPAEPDPASIPVPTTPAPSVQEPPLPPDPLKPEIDQAASRWGWRSWWSRPDGYSEPTKTKDSVKGDVQRAQSTSLPGPTPSEEPDAKSKGLEGIGAQAESTTESTEVAQAAVRRDIQTTVADTNETSKPAAAVDAKAEATRDKSQARATSASWFWLWSNAQNAQTNTPPPAPPTDDPFSHVAITNADAAIADPPATTTPQPSEAPTDTTINTTKSVPGPTTEPSKPAGWAFWYRGKPGQENKADEDTAQKHVGEVAVFDTPSQSHPEAAQFNEQGQNPAETPQEQSPPPKSEPIVTRSLRSLRGRPKSTASTKSVSVETPSTSNAPTPKGTSPVREDRKVEIAPPAQPASKQASKPKQEPPNLLLPGFHSTYSLVQQPNFWQQIRQYFLGGEAPAPHLHINPAPPKIKKAIAIGVHGFFPAPIIQKVLGQPTGTSIRFANAAAAAIKDWTEARGYTPEIEQIALEGEGFIADRVNTLWKLLLNWIDHIKAADFILVACHSQGVPVAMMLVAKLIQFGCVNSARIGVCAMAGVNMGPFIEYKTKYFGPTAAELFEFSNPKSLVSQMHLAALDEVLRFGVRILYVGSIDDQLVSLESSTFSTLSHPYIYRAVFVDGRIHVPDFLTHLVGFTLKLRNLGLPDHGLIRELSPALAGSLYGGEGHSRVYEDPAVYALAMHHVMETTSLPILPAARPGTGSSLRELNIPVVGDKSTPKDVYKLRVAEYASSASSTNPNPYFLPWAMRGLLEEEFVKRELGREVEELLGMFEAWKPAGKLKDVKFRLEGVRSKL